jgi:hypothetical protein
MPWPTRKQNTETRWIGVPNKQSSPGRPRGRSPSQRLSKYFVPVIAQEQNSAVFAHDSKYP